MMTDPVGLESDDSTSDARSTTHEPAQQTTSDPASPDRSPGTGERSSRFWRTAPWVLAILGLAAAAFSTFQWLDLRADEQTRAEVQAVASDFMLTLTNWDANDGLDDTVEELRQAGSEQFLQEIDNLFGTGLRQELEQVRAVSSGEIQDVFVQSIDERESVVFAVVIQELELGVSQQSNSMVRSARIALRKADDRWLVTRVELVNDSGFGPDGATEPGAGETEPAGAGSEEGS